MVVDADCVLFVDVKDMVKPTHSIDRLARRVVSRLVPECRVLSLGYGDIGISSWSEDYSQQIPAHHAVVADTAVALPLLLEECRRLVASDDVERTAQRGEWTRALTELHDRTWAGWAQHAADVAGETPVATAQLASAVWEVVREYDWVLTAGTASEWALKLWDFDKPYRHPGRQLGTATQIGISLGVALAHKGTGRLVVDIQPDGDLMFDVGALWVASRYRLPMLVVRFGAHHTDGAYSAPQRLCQHSGQCCPRLARVRDVPDHLDLVDGDQTLGHKLVELVLKRPHPLGGIDDHDRHRQVPGQAQKPGGVNERGCSKPLHAAEHTRPRQPGLVGPVHDLAVQRLVVPGVVLVDEDRHSQCIAGQPHHGLLATTDRAATAQVTAAQGAVRRPRAPPAAK